SRGHCRGRGALHRTLPGCPIRRPRRTRRAARLDSARNSRIAARPGRSFASVAFRLPPFAILLSRNPMGGDMNRTSGELARHLGANLEGDANLLLSGVASPEQARAADLIYVDSPRHGARAESSAAMCVIAPPRMRLRAKTIIESSEPKLAFAKAAAWLLPRATPAPGIHPSAIVAPAAQVSGSACIGPHVVIEDSAVIGEKSVVQAFCFIGARSRVGAGCWLHPRVTLYAGSRLGNRVELHSGVVIGGDGFGYVFGEGRHWKFPQVGEIEIGDDVEIGSNTAMDRGSLGLTRVGSGTKIDNLVQVAHNVQIGEHSIIVSQTGISGSCTLGNRVIV